MTSVENEQPYAWKESYRKVKKELALLKEAVKKKEAAKKAQKDQEKQVVEQDLFIERKDLHQTTDETDIFAGKP